MLSDNLLQIRTAEFAAVTTKYLTKPRIIPPHFPLTPPPPWIGVGGYMKLCSNTVSQLPFGTVATSGHLTQEP